MTMYMPYSYGTYNSITAYYPMKYYDWNSHPWKVQLLNINLYFSSPVKRQFTKLYIVWTNRCKWYGESNKGIQDYWYG